MTRHYNAIGPHSNIVCLYLWCCRPDRLVQAIPQWQAAGGDYIGIMNVGGDVAPGEPIGVLVKDKYYLYASGGMFAFSRRAVLLLTRDALHERRITAGGDDTPMHSGQWDTISPTSMTTDWVWS